MFFAMSPVSQTETVNTGLSVLIPISDDGMIFKMKEKNTQSSFKHGFRVEIIAAYNNISPIQYIYI